MDWVGRWRYVAVVGTVAACSSSEPSTSQPALCGPIGASLACACTNGHTGAQVCQPDGTFGRCECIPDGLAAGSSGDPGNGGATDGDSAGGTSKGGASRGGGDSGGKSTRGGSPNGSGGRISAGAGGAPTSGGTGETGGSAQTGGTLGGAGHDGGSAGHDATDDSCSVGDIAGCACELGTGYRGCVDGVFGACTCPSPEGTGGAAGAGGSGGDGGAGGEGPCSRSEICNQRDDDCNGLVDDRFACPSGTVNHTAPFTEAVYLVGTTIEGSSGYDAVAQVWPEIRLEYFTGFWSYVTWFQFRPSDGSLFYHDLQKGIFLNGRGAATDDDTLFLTPPCGVKVGRDFGFDAADTLYYRCTDTLRRANGELVARNIQQIAGILPDGRSVVTRATRGNSVFAVLSPEGNELGVLDPADFFSGSLTLLPQATTTRASAAYIGFLRQYEAGNELVVYTVDAESRFRLMRRVLVADVGLAQLIVANGTVFIREYDRAAAGYDEVRAYLPDDTSRIVWRENETVFVRSHGDTQLLVGPRMP